MTESELRAMLDRYIQGNATDEEVKLLEDFFKSYDQENSLTLFPDRIREEILTNIYERTHERNKPNVWRIAMKVAASLVLVAVVVVVASRNWRSDVQNVTVSTLTEQTKRGEKSEFLLPDSTFVHLNAGSSLQYFSTFSEKREVVLTGEAYFEVTHDESRPFIVSANHSRVIVLGTSFNVKAHTAKNVEITLVSGRVNVQSIRASEILLPGTQALVDVKTDSIYSNNVDVRQFTSWKDNVLFFDQTSLVDVVEILEAWYDTNITIASPAMNTCTITGQYKDESLENVLRSVEFLLNADIDFKNPKQITIRGNSCKK